MSKTSWRVVAASRCGRTDCFAYKSTSPHNCTALIEAPDPCPFYKTAKQHYKELKALKEHNLRRYGINV